MSLKFLKVLTMVLVRETITHREINMFIIVDWANNHLFQDKEFETFEDGWDFLFEHFDQERDQDENYLDAYYVIEKDSRSGRLARGLNPK